MPHADEVTDAQSSYNGTSTQSSSADNLTLDFWTIKPAKPANHKRGVVSTAGAKHPYSMCTFLMGSATVFGRQQMTIHDQLCRC